MTEEAMDVLTTANRTLGITAPKWHAPSVTHTYEYIQQQTLGGSTTSPIVFFARQGRPGQGPLSVCETCSTHSCSNIVSHHRGKEQGDCCGWAIAPVVYPPSLFPPSPECLLFGAIIVVM